MVGRRDLEWGLRSGFLLQNDTLKEVTVSLEKWVEPHQARAERLIYLPEEVWDGGWVNPGIVPIV